MGQPFKEVVYLANDSVKRAVFRFLAIVYGVGYFMMGRMMMGPSRWFLFYAQKPYVAL